MNGIFVNDIKIDGKITLVILQLYALELLTCYYQSVPQSWEVIESHRI